MPSDKDDVSLVESHDGSHTLLSERFGVTYHSHFGAIEESLTVFLSAGFHAKRFRGAKSLSILEVGFGTGLNALLTLLEAETFQVSTLYTGIEAYPIKEDVFRALNYLEVLGQIDNQGHFEKMHLSESGVQTRISPIFSFQKRIEKLEDFQAEDQYDVIYFDAFAPSAQPELWTLDILKKLFSATKDNGVLVTYCAKGQFKRDLKSAGYTIEALPGPGKKREMTRAWKLA